MRKIIRKKTIIAACIAIPVAAITTILIRRRREKTYAGL